MNTEAHRLALRRRALIRRAAVERVQLVHQFAALKPAFDVADTVWRAGAWAREHAAWLAFGATVVIAARPRVAWRWVQRGWSLWRMWQRARSGVGALFQEIETRLRA